MDTCFTTCSRLGVHCLICDRCEADMAACAAREASIWALRYHTQDTQKFKRSRFVASP